MNSNTSAFVKRMTHPLKFRFFELINLPSAFFSGVRIKDIDDQRCTVTVPFKWFSQNPFRSTYFACLAMAAEMSTGLLAMMHIYKLKPGVSMLVIKMEASYFKKAVARTSFCCEDGKLFAQTVEKAVATGQPQTLVARSVGTSPGGEIVAEFLITWSFKAKKT